MASLSFNRVLLADAFNKRIGKTFTCHKWKFYYLNGCTAELPLTHSSPCPSTSPSHTHADPSKLNLILICSSLIHFVLFLLLLQARPSIGCR